MRIPVALGSGPVQPDQAVSAAKDKVVMGGDKDGPSGSRSRLRRSTMCCAEVASRLAIGSSTALQAPASPDKDKGADAAAPSTRRLVEMPVVERLWGLAGRLFSPHNRTATKTPLAHERGCCHSAFDWAHVKQVL